jgi:putative hemolysin
MHYLAMAYVSRPVMALVIFLTAFVTGIIAALLGDALPKLISRTKPEKITAMLLPAIKFFYIPLLPFVLPAMKFASFFHSAFHEQISNNTMTEDEIHLALLEGEKHGIVESNERTMVEGVFYLGDRPVSAFMTHRSEIQWLDCNAPYEEIREKALEHRQQRCFPVVNGSQDEIIGAVYLEDIILDFSQPSPRGLRAILMKAQFVPETMSALKAFESFKQGQANFLFVMDEYGGLAGVISITALVEEIVGELSAPVKQEEPIKKLEDGSWLADGTLSIDEAAKALSLTGLPEEDEFHTLAGFILYLAGELPQIGDSFEFNGYKFQVVDKDGNIIDKLMITKIEEKTE